MAFYGDSDIPMMIAELGVPVVASGVNGYGILDLNDEVEEMQSGRGAVVVRAVTLLVQTSRWAANAIAMDAQITVDGAAYVIIRPLSEGDGALTKLLLRRA